MIAVMLDDDEQRVARYLAEQRQARNCAARVVNQRRTARSDLDIHLDGVGAELAFARLLNVYPDLTTTPRRGGCDCHLPDRRRVDVKSAPRTASDLLVLQHKPGDADLYALMVGAFPAFRFAGWIDALTYFAFARVVDLGHGPTYAIPQSELDPELPKGSAL